MQYVLHVTQRCNFACGYCSARRNDEDMPVAIARKTADIALANAMANGDPSTCISFYGGEPLLRRSLIYDTVGYCGKISSGTGVDFHFRMTTNASLIDGEFIAFAVRHGMKLALSIDGLPSAHDAHRRDTDGNATYERISPICDAVLAAMPDTPAMLTINPDTAAMLHASIQHLHTKGFRTICTTPNYSAQWDDEAIALLGEQYAAIADWYGGMLLTEADIKLPLFDSKMVNALLPVIDDNKCIPGQNRVTVTADGSIYPCIQYANHPAYAFGNVCGQTDFARLDAIREEAAAIPPGCADCALLGRCDNKCGCKNLSTTGCTNCVSPMVCAHERMLIPIADRLGATLFD